MKLFLASLILSSLIIDCEAYLPPSHFGRAVTSLKSSNDAAFSKFAASLEDEPEDEQPQPWQAKLEDLLDPKTNLADRQILMSELLSSNDEIRESVLDALANRKIDPLLTPTGRKLQDGTRAVVRQIANDILPQLGKAPPKFPPSPSSLEKVGSRLFDVVTNQIQKNIEDLQEDLSDPINRIPQRLTKQAEGFVQEARNVFLETPEGLSEPEYSVEQSCDLYEIRNYESYNVASTVMDEGEDLASTGTAFNSLAGFLFGLNKESKTMEMTTPVTTTSSNELRFYLADSSIPEPPEDSSVEIIEVPSAFLAVRKFTGFVTDGEIARQKDTLLQALEMDGVELDVGHGEVVPHVVFQYNPPYTVPIVRRNEIAVPVRQADDETGATSLKQEWSVEEAEAATEEDVSSANGSEAHEINNDASSADDEEELEDDVSPSDY